MNILKLLGTTKRPTDIISTRTNDPWPAIVDPRGQVDEDGRGGERVERARQCTPLENPTSDP
eukprot:7362523-Pyramimonas_sp.AAC.1